MELTEIVDIGVGFFQTHTVIAVIIIVVLGALLYLRPKAFLKLAGGLLVVVVIFYLLSFMGDMVSSGISKKGEIVDKSP